MSSKSISYPTVVTPTEIVACVEECMKAEGLQEAKESFFHMERVLSCLPWWGEVKAAVQKLFASERIRLEQLELERAKAAAPNIYQWLPTADSGIKVDKPYFDGSMYEIKDNDNVNLGGNNDGQDKH